MINPGYLNQIFKLSLLPAVILLPESNCFTIVEANYFYENFSGKTAAQLAGKCFLQTLTDFLKFTPNEVEEIRQSLLSIINTKETNKIAGNKNNWQVENVPVINRDNNIEYIIHTLSAYNDDSFSAKQNDFTTNKISPDLKKLMDFSPDAICTIDKAGKFLNVSAAAEKMWGYPIEELMGFSYADLICEEDIEPTIKAGEAIFSGAIISSFENRCIHKSGYLVPTIWSAKWDDAEKVMYCIAKDATESKKSALEKNLMIYNTEEAFVLVDKELRIVDYNHQFKILYEKYLGKKVKKRESILDYARPERREILKELYKKVLEGHTETTEITIPVKNEPARYYSFTYKPALNEQSAIIGIFVTAKDLTDIIYARKQIELSEEKYRLLFNTSPIPKWVYDLESLKILDVNERAIAHYGYSREEFLSLTVNDLKRAEDQPKMQKIREDIQNGKGLMHFGIFTQIKKDKSLIKAEVSGNKFTFMERDCMMVESIDVTERENALLQLKNNETKLLTAQKIAKIGYWQWLPGSNYLYWSHEVYNIWEVDEDTFGLTHNKFLSSLHPDDKADFQNEIQNALEVEKVYDVEYRIILQNGSIKWVNEKGALIKDDNGAIILFEGTVQDITENKIAREKLLVSEARHRGIVESQTNYLIRTDLNGKYSFGNNKFIKDFGWIYGKNDIIGKEALMSVIEYHHPRLLQTVEKCFANTNKVFQVELDKPKQDGGVITTLWDFICLTDSKGQPTEMQCVGIDISDRKKAEDALQESNTRYEHVSKATSDAIWDWDLGTNMMHWGDAFKTIFGYEKMATDNGGINWTNYLHSNDRERVINNLTAFINGKELHWNDEYRYLKADGSFAVVLDKGFVIRNENGKALKMVGAMQDITERKTLQNLLNKANRLARIGSWEIDVVKDTVYWSDITKEIREVAPGFNPNLAIGIQYFKKGKDRDTIALRVKECRENGTHWDEELQLITHKGNLKWIRIIGEAEMINGKCVKIFGSFQDIDAKKKAELEIAKLYEEKNTILESIGDGFFTVDKNWIVTYWNNQAEKMLGALRDDVLGKNLWNVFENTVNLKAYRNYNKAVKTKKAIHFEDYYKVLDKWFDINAYPSNNGLSVYFKDVTSRKKAEEAIRISNERYTIISKATNDSVWDWNLITNEVERPGRALESLFGYEPVAPANVDAFWKTHVVSEDWQNVVIKRNNILENSYENYWDDEYRFLKADGSIAYVYDRGFIIRNAENKAVRIIGASQDISKLREKEMQLKDMNEKLQKWARELSASNSELEHFAYIASHDLQEPLRMITSFLSQLEKKYADALDEKGKRYIHFAVDGARRMKRIILDLLEYSRISRVSELKEQVDLNKLIAEILLLHQKQIKEKKAIIKFNSLPKIFSFKTPVRQVFQNLLSNSLKYYREQEGNPLTITIGSKEFETHWEFCIQDNGIGINQQEFEKIFVIFQRLHNKQEFSGTGMGLAIAKKIIDTMGGKIWLTSAEGKGSTFYFTILKDDETGD